jgi:hypothetical protein
MRASIVCSFGPRGIKKRAKIPLKFSYLNRIYFQPEVVGRFANCTTEGSFSNRNPNTAPDRMKVVRRRFLHLAVGAAALPAVSRVAVAQALSDAADTLHRRLCGHSSRSRSFHSSGDVQYNPLRTESRAEGLGAADQGVGSRLTSPPRANHHQQHEEISCRPSEPEQGSQGGYPRSACATGPQISVGIVGPRPSSKWMLRRGAKRVV